MQAADLRAKGLFPHPSPLDDIPKGALLIADNVVIDRENTIETRRGFKTYGTALTLGAGERPNKAFLFGSTKLLHYASTLAYDSDSLGTWTNYSGTYTPPTGANRIQGVEANKNFYFTSSVGVKKLDSVTGTVKMAGMYKGLDGSGATAGASGFMANNTQVAYRVVFGITDANGNKILGAPSQRIIVTNNSGGTRNVDLTFTLPSGITTSHFYQVYRSGQTAGVSDEPTDEMQLIVEKNPSSAEVTALSITYTDVTSDSLRGASLYTNPSQQGILQANDAPPIAKDLTLYKTQVLYANTVTKHRANITLIAVDGSGFVADDTITIAGVIYTGKAAENVASAQFKVTTSGTASQNIDATAKSLIKVINGYSGNTSVYAYYLTGFNDLPGQILIEERGLGGTSFAITSSRGSAFSPTLPSSGTSYASTNETSPNRVYISKTSQPEAVPILNYLEVGSAQKAILRILALRDSVFVLKEDGVFRITGDTFADMRVTEQDTTIILTAPDSAVKFNNQVFCYTNQGVIALSDSGSAIMSRSLEKNLLTISTSQYANFGSATFGVSYESDRKYILFTVSAAADTYATQAYVYNSATNSWTRWVMSRSCGIVGADDKLYLGSADTSVKKMYQERKSYDITDYADDEFALTITGQSGTTLNVASTADAVVGYEVVQGNRASTILEVVNATTLTMSSAPAWNLGSAATMLKPITSTVTWVPQHCNNPGLLKHFVEIAMFFRDANFDSLTMSFSTDVSPYEQEVEVTPKDAGPWGLFPWGLIEWGGEIAHLQPIRTLIPKEKTRAHWLNVTVSNSQARTSFALAGIALIYEGLSERFR